MARAWSGSALPRTRWSRRPAVLGQLAPEHGVTPGAGDPGWLSVKVEPERAAEVNRALATAGIYASGLETGSDLESLFLSLTGGSAPEASGEGTFFGLAGAGRTTGETGPSDWRPDGDGREPVRGRRPQAGPPTGVRDHAGDAHRPDGPDLPGRRRDGPPAAGRRGRAGLAPARHVPGRLHPGHLLPARPRWPVRGDLRRGHRRVGMDAGGRSRRPWRGARAGAGTSSANSPRSP